MYGRALKMSACIDPDQANSAGPVGVGGVPSMSCSKLAACGAPGRARTAPTVDHHRVWTAGRAGGSRAPASGGLPAASSHQPDNLAPACRVLVPPTCCCGSTPSGSPDGLKDVAAGAGSQRLRCFSPSPCSSLRRSSPRFCTASHLLLAASVAARSLSPSSGWQADTPYPGAGRDGHALCSAWSPSHPFRPGCSLRPASARHSPRRGVPGWRCSSIHSSRRWTWRAPSRTGRFCPPDHNPGRASQLPTLR